MLERLPGGTARTTNNAASSSLFAFVPRQVTLLKRKNMKNKDLSETLVNGFIEKTPTGDTVKKAKAKKSEKKKKTKGRDQTPLLLSIAAYLQQRGLTETLAALQSKASVGQLDDSKVHGLEEIFFEYLDSRSTDNAPEELDVLNNGLTKENQEESVKTKKKKNKQDFDFSDEKVHDISTDNCVLESQLDESDRKLKDKKRKKSKSSENGASENLSLDVKNLKSKDKKKKNVSPEGVIEKDTKELDPAGALPLAENSVSKDKKSSKKRKRVGSEENASQPDGDEKKTTDMGKTEEEHASKKTKTVVNDEADAEKSHETSFDKKLNFLSEGEKTPKGFGSVAKAANDDLDTSGREDTGPLKSKKKQQNNSAQPKTVNAFQRVKIDEVKFADDRLQDNSYWAKGGAEVGYGAKAQEVLGQVRGRDFRHEKTKKKRGSYRGGQIDLQTHSIKFNYSDEE